MSLIVEFTFDKGIMHRKLSVVGMETRLERKIVSGYSFLIAHICPSNRNLINIEKLLVTCGGYDTTYPIGCTLSSTPLTDERYRLCESKAGDLPGIVYGSIACYFKLSEMDGFDILKGAVQYRIR